MTLWQLTAWPSLHSFSFKRRIVKGKNLEAATPTASVIEQIYSMYFISSHSQQTQRIYGRKVSVGMNNKSIKKLPREKCVAPQFSCCRALSVSLSSSFHRFLSTFKKSICNCWSTLVFPSTFSTEELRGRT